MAKGKGNRSKGRGNKSLLKSTPEASVQEEDCVISCPGTSSIPCEIVTSAEWITLFDEACNRDFASILNATLSADSWKHYQMADEVDAFNEMFKCTGDTAYLDKSLEMTCNIMDTAVVSSSLPNGTYNDGYLSWPTLTHGSAPNGSEQALFESFYWRYATETLRCMKEAGLDTNPAYSQKFNELLSFAEVNMLEKWLSRGDHWIYRNRTHMASHWAYIAMNLAKCSNDPAIVAQANTIRDNIDFAGFPAGINPGGSYLGYDGANLTDQFYPHPNAPGGLSWYRTWMSGINPEFVVQDLTHGNADIAYICSSVECGGYWTQAILDQLVITASYYIDQGDNPFPLNVDGTGANTNPGNEGWMVDGFDKLGRFDCGLQQKLDTYTGVDVNRVGWYATMATNAKALGA